MDALVLLGSFFLLMMLGLPIAYSLGLSALIGALWIDIPLDAVMIQLASGVNSSRCWPSPSSCWPAPSWPRAAWPSGWWPSQACWWASSAAACRW